MTKSLLMRLAVVFSATTLVGACSSNSPSTPGSGSGGMSSSGGNGSGSGGSGSGGNGSGGNSGSGGKMLAADCVSNMADLIANFKEDNGVYPLDGREGGFYTYGDPSETSGDPLAVLDPAEGTTPGIDTSTGNDECSGPGSLHVKATGFKVWGAALGTNFAPPDPADSSLKGWYDASKYKGLSFWAKAATELKSVQISFPDVYTDGGANAMHADPNDNERCVYGVQSDNCSPFLVKLGDPDYPNYMDMKIDTTWRRFDIMFADTKQDKNNPPGYLLPAPDHIDLQHLTAMAIQVNALHDDATMAVIANDFEIWVDDMYFLR